jgi:hypothetical protein
MTFFFLRIPSRADYLFRPMWSLFRSLLLVVVSAAAVRAEEAIPPLPAPEATPAPAETPAASPTPAATEPVPPAPLEPATTPEATPDVIPLEGVSPTSGAPLDTQDIAPLPDPSMPDDAFTMPNAVIPDEAPPPVSQALDNAQEKARLQNIRYKEVRVQAEKDPKVKSLLDQANKAKTQEDKRAALREYYRLLFKKIIAIDKSLEAQCLILEDAYIRRLAQTRLEPTIPLNPPPTPEPLN